MVTGLKIFFVLILFTIPLLALDPGKTLSQYNVRRWDRENGYRGGGIYAFAQTQDGYIWIGAQGGLLKFDGVNFRELDEKRNPDVAGRTVRSLLAHDGKLMAGTDSGIFYRENGRFRRLIMTGENKVIMDVMNVCSLHRDRHGNFWAGSSRQGLFSINKSNAPGGFEMVEILQGDKGVRSIFQDKTGDIWVTTSTGIYRIAPKEKKIKRQLREVHGVPVETFSACVHDSDTGILWIGTGDRGLIKFNINNKKVARFDTHRGGARNVVTCLFLDRENTLWVGTDSGIARMKNGKLEWFTGHKGLDDGAVYAIFQDRKGALWIGTLERGLFQITGGIFSSFSSEEGLGDDLVNCANETSGGDLLIGTANGVSRWRAGVNGGYPEIAPEWTKENGLPHPSVLCIKRHPEYGLFIGTLDGLLHINTRNDRRLVTAKADGLSGKRVYCLHLDGSGNLWIGTENGLNRMSLATGAVGGLGKKNTLPAGTMVNFIIDGDGGGLILGTGDGVYRYRDKVFSRQFAGTPLETLSYYCVYRDQKGIVRFGTSGGLVSMKNWKEVRPAPQKELKNIHIKSVVTDNKGFIWLGSHDGIRRIAEKDLDTARPLIRHFGKPDGMKSDWCTRAAIQTGDGKLWFPTAVGIAMVSPGLPGKKMPAPNVVIEDIIVDGETIDTRPQLLENKILRLKAGSKRIVIVYTGFDYANPPGLQFRTRLDGFDKDFVPWGKDRREMYAGLDPGTYTFNVVCRDSDNLESEVASFGFTIEPYIFQTVWFYPAVALLGLMAFFSFYFLRVRYLKARQAELALKVNERTRDLKERNIQLEMAQEDLRQSKNQIEDKNLQLETQSEKLKEMDRIKSRFFANISHEFRTPLTLIMGPLEQMMDEEGDGKQKKKLNMMLRNSRRVLGLINQLLDLSRFESGAVKLRASRQNVVSLLRGIVSNFQPLAARNNLEMVFESSRNEIPCFVDAPKVEDIIGNLLINAVKFTPPEGNIRVRVERQDEKAEGFPEGFIRVTVADTGPGISPEQLPYIFNRFYQTPGRFENTAHGSGIGLALVKELVTVHHGKIDVYSRQDQGTEFIIQLPLGDALLEQGEKMDEQPGYNGDHTEMERKAAEGLPMPDKTSEDECPVETGETGGAGGIILVIDDSADIRNYIREALEPVYTVIEAGDGDEGLEKAYQYIPDLVICDIMMPGKDGYELCGILKKDIKTSHIPIVLLTAKALESNIVQGLETGADDYITKPFNTAILLARIDNLIQLRRQLQLTVNREMTFQPGRIKISSIDNTFLGDLKKVIREHLSDPEFNVEQLAKLLYLDRSTVYRKVQALTGESPTDFIRSCRLKRGAELLKNNFGTVLEVAFEVGFSSANYFTKCFKKRFHRLPSNFQSSEST